MAWLAEIVLRGSVLLNWPGSTRRKETARDTDMPSALIRERATGPQANARAFLATKARPVVVNPAQFFALAMALASS